MDANLLSYILRAKNRREVLLFLVKETLTPAQIMRRTKMYESHVSRTLKELLDKKLIVCKNPNERRFRFYNITKLGRNMTKEADKILKDIKRDHKSTTYSK